MKRIGLLITITTVFILGGSAVLAKNDASGGKGNPSAGQKAAAKGTAEQNTETSQPQKKTRTIATRDPKTGKATSKQVPAAEDAEAGQDQVKTEGRKVRERTKAAEEKAQNPAAAAEEKSKAEKEKTDAVNAKVKEKSDAITAREKEKADAIMGRGKGADQKGAAQAKRLQHEDQKHQQRQARLAEMLKVAQEKGDDKTIGRIQQLMDKENSRYNKKNTKMAERGSKEETPKGGNAASAGKPDKADDAAKAGAGTAEENK